MARALVFAATFNEKDNVAPLVDRISSVSQDFDVSSSMTIRRTAPANCRIA